MTTKSTLKRIARRVPHVVGILLIVAVVVPFVIYAVPGVVGADASYIVLSGSMEPTASPGDVVIVESVDPVTVNAGDVIAYRTGESAIPTTHRVTDVVETETGRAFETKGDANADTDQQPVGPQQIVGRVMTVEGHLLVIPYIGRVVLFVGTPLGFATLVALPLGLLFANEAWLFVRGNRSEPESTAGTDGDGDDRTDSAVADPGPDDGAGGVSIGRSELAFLVPVFAAFAAYSTWTATVLFTTLSIAVAVAAGVLLVLSTILYMAVVRRARATGDAETRPAFGATPTGAPSVEVETYGDLLAIARSDDRRIEWDADRGRYRTVGGPVSFVYDGDLPPWGEPADLVATDTGPGREPDFRAMLFGPRSESPRMTTDGGVGANDRSGEEDRS